MKWAIGAGVAGWFGLCAVLIYTLFAWRQWGTRDLTPLDLVFVSGLTLFCAFLGWTLLKGRTSVTWAKVHIYAGAFLVCAAGFGNWKAAVIPAVPFAFGCLGLQRVLRIMPAPIAPAHPRLRRWVLACIAVWLTSLIASYLFIADLKAWLVLALTAWIILPLFPLFAYFVYQGWCALQRGIYPAPQVPLIVDTVIVTGKQVRAKAWTAIALGTTGLVAGLSLLLMFFLY